MIINLTLGFQNLSNKSSDHRNRTYSLFLGDTVQITKDGPVLLTNYDKALESISYNDGEDEEDDSTRVAKKESVLPTRGAILENQLRKNEDKAELDNKRKSHQQELFEKRQQDGLARWAGRKDAAAAEKELVFKKFESYRTGVPLPRNVGSLKVWLFCLFFANHL